MMEMDKKVVRKDSYYSFKNKLLRFNKQYEFHLGPGYDVDENYFEPFAEAWDKICSECPPNIKYTDLKDEHFELLTKASEKVYEKLKQLAINRGLGGTYYNDEGELVNEYTYAAGDIYELALCALGTYTNVLELCMYNMSNGGIARAQAVTNPLYNKSQLHVLDDCEKVKSMADPIAPFGVMGLLNIYKENTYQGNVVTVARTPYAELVGLKAGPRQELKPVVQEPINEVVSEDNNKEEIKAPREQNPEENELLVNQNQKSEADQPSSDDQEEEEEFELITEGIYTHDLPKEENEPVIEQEQEKAPVDDASAVEEELPLILEKPDDDEPLAEYDQVTKYVQFEEQPQEIPAINVGFYRYFSRFERELSLNKGQMRVSDNRLLADRVWVLGHDPLTAQALITAATTAHLKTLNDDKEFLTKMRPIYRHVRRAAFEAHVRKAISTKTDIDFNSVATEVDQLMGALLYTVDPLGFQEKNPKTIARATMLLGGNVSNDEQSVGVEDRKAVLEHEKNAYRAIVEDEFAPDVEKCFNAYAENNMSSRRIANNASSLLKQFLTAQKGTKTEPPAQYHTQIEMKKLVMDEACALEQRIETRYATRAAKFFRGISYLRQRYQLNRIKKAIGISKDQRVADVYVQTRLNDLFVDTSDHNLYDNAAKNIDPKTVLKNIAANFADRAKVKLPQVSKEAMAKIYGKHINNLSELVGDPKNDRYTMDDVNEIGEAYFETFGHDPYEARTYVVEENPKPLSVEGFLDDKAEPNNENKEEVKENDVSSSISNESDFQNAQEEVYDADLEEAKRREAELAEEKARQLKLQEIRKQMFDKNIKIKENLIKDYSRELKEATELREKHLNQAKESLAQHENELNLFKEERDKIAKDIETVFTEQTALYVAVNQLVGDIAEAAGQREQTLEDMEKTKEYINKGVHVKEVSDQIEQMNKDLELKEEHKKGYEEKIQNAKNNIKALQDKIGDLQVVNKKEFELEKQVKKLEIEVKLWKENEQDIIETGKWLPDIINLDEYHNEAQNVQEKQDVNLPEDFEEPIYDELKVRLSLHIDDEQSGPIEPKIEEPKKTAKVIEK